LLEAQYHVDLLSFKRQISKSSFLLQKNSQPDYLFLNATDVMAFGNKFALFKAKLHFFVESLLYFNFSSVFSLCGSSLAR